ncbi:hypothetical protein LSH36_425g00023 [Paralvinella palmiformis]|uniref:G-protein coupled receptors family 1 profile domain-containing protein n=1 Tax=Paralvinella palmiformis TaxID=53620 RepID=A0AAD9JC19_9ANNE|nr:hypothetical protein LSH36_425g00023 [Paralvinella palmiformis]
MRIPWKEIIRQKDDSYKYKIRNKMPVFALFIFSNCSWNEIKGRRLSHQEMETRSLTRAPQYTNTIISYYDMNYQEGEENLPVDHVKRIIFRYIAPCLIFSGIIGNLLSLVVLLSKQFKKVSSSSTFILSVLALTDIGVLSCGLMRHWILNLTEDRVDVRCLSVFSCKVHVFLTYFLPQLSAWSLVLLTFERFVSVKWPMKAKQILNRSRMITAWTIMILTLTIINSHFFITQSLEQIDIKDYEDNTETLVLCSSVKAIYFVNVIWPWLDLVMLSIIPTMSILTFNITLSLEIIQAHRRRVSQMRVKETDESLSITAMLIGISVLFLVTTIPVSVYFIWIQYNSDDTYKQLFTTLTAYSITNIIYYLNSSVNFLVYCISGSKFRNALVAIFRCR